MSYQTGRRPGLNGRPGSRTARAGLALAGLVLTVSGCGHVLPLGLSAVPVPGRLAAAIALQPGAPRPRHNPRSPRARRRPPRAPPAPPRFPQPARPPSAPCASASSGPR